jgi:hypothetical protein
MYGPESDHPSEGSYSCATGTAAWMLIVVRPDVEGLRWCWTSPAPRGLSIRLLSLASCILHRVVVKKFVNRPMVSSMIGAEDGTLFQLCLVDDWRADAIDFATRI